MIYREDCALIARLLDMMQTFVHVNGNLPNPSRHIKKSNQFMNEMIVFLMTCPIRCANKSEDTTFYLHFMKSDEITRFEEDACENNDS